jgi:dienelactone hydrolase
MMPIRSILTLTIMVGVASAQTAAPIPASDRKPSDGPFQPEMIKPGGIILPLYPPDSSFLKKDRIHEAEIYNSANGGNRPITNVINIHNPTIEVHLAKDRSLNGAAVILAPGGGHKILWVGPEGADYVADFDQFGITTIILRYRLRIDGYEPSTDAVNDAFQAIRIVRAHAKEWNLDPAKIGMMGFSAGAELSAPAALFYDEFSKNNSATEDPLAKVSARPDFVGIIYPGPTPFTKAPDTLIPANVPPSFLASAGSGDRIHAMWAADYFNPMLNAAVPNLEMHIYGRGTHGVNRKGSIPYSSWMERYVEWLDDLGFLAKPGVETKAARDVADFVKNAKK